MKLVIYLRAQSWELVGLAQVPWAGPGVCKCTVKSICANLGACAGSARPDPGPALPGPGKEVPAKGGQCEEG